MHRRDHASGTIVARRRAFTMLELLVIILIVSLLIAILLPSLGMQRDMARTAVCQNNLRSLGQKMQLYLAESDGKMFGYASDNPEACWPKLLRQGDYGPGERALMCPVAYLTGPGAMRVAPVPIPMAPGGAVPPEPPPPVQPGTADQAWTGIAHVGAEVAGGYGFNGWLYNAADTRGNDLRALLLAAHKTDDAAYLNYFYSVQQLRMPEGVPLFADSVWDEAFPEWGDAPPMALETGFNAPVAGSGQEMGRFCIARHRKTINVAFMDAHSERSELPRLWSLRWTANWRTPALPVLP